ncbi:MAG TPA: hypothetical protein VGJ20_20605 [Xanthobacteraceae bacterium]|jgi:hypothetical protein
MPDWPPLDEPEEHARRYDPDTSKETARRIKIRSQALRVLRVYAVTGRALIDHDAYRLAGFPPGRTSHQRCSDLREHGFIARTGARGLTPSRHAANLCQITELGMRYVLGIEPFVRH